VISGQVEMMTDAITTMAPIAKSGRVRALATTGKTRSEVMPQTPSVSEAGVPGYEATIWLGIMAPAGTPKAAIDRLNAEITKVVNRSDIRQTWREQGAVPIVMTAGEFDGFLRGDIAKWAKIVKLSGARPDQ
jgi:tripartite-type tricarboxylate transporter receptor subunit TctC